MRNTLSPVRRRSSVATNALVELGEVETREHFWEKYFADPSQWWDNRYYKKNLKVPDFKHKVTQKTLWVDDWSTPLWVKAMLKFGTQSKLPCDVGSCLNGSQEIIHPNRVPMGKFGRRNTLPTTARESKNVVQVGSVTMHMQRAKTTAEAIDVLKDRLQQGIATDSYMYVEVLKRCLNLKDLPAVKQVHECIIQSGMQQNTYVANNLVIVYVRCGRLENACRVFDELVMKDVISWNVMIGGYAQHSRAEVAMEAFNQMHQASVQPNAITFLSILKACASASALKWGKEVHAYIRRGDFESDVRVGTALLKMYSKCGSIDDARLVFDRMEERDVMSWNVMIGAYAESGRAEEAYRLFLQMLRDGFKPDAFTYSSILNACARVEWVKEVHMRAREGGFESDVHVGSTLVHMYAKCGSIDDARLLFDRMEKRNAITWNVMIGAYAKSGCGEEAYRLYIQLIEEGFQANAVTYVSILNACASAGTLNWVKEIHKHARERGFETDMRVGSALVHVYGKCGSMDDARLVFDRMDTRNVITWNMMIGAYAESGYGEKAYRLFLQMIKEGFQPDAFTYSSILNACASAGALEWVKEVHHHAREGGFESDTRVASALVHMYSKCGSIDDARLVFDRMENRDVISWNVMIGAYAESGCGEDAYRLYLEMIRDGFQSNAVTYVSILNAHASAGALEWVKEVHSHARERGFESDVRVGTALVRMYAKCGSIDDARLVFDRMQERNVISWNVMIGAYAESGFDEEAYRLYLRTIREGCQPDSITYSSILNACASAGTLEWAKGIHCHAREGGFESDVLVGNALVHMYAKCGSIDDARLVFDRMEERDLISWNVMIGGLAQHGCGFEALEVFRRMNAAGVKPDGSSFVAVLSACSHSGLIDEGRRLFVAMSQDYGIVSDVQHWTCMVDILGRAGHLEEAKLFIDNMPVEPNAATWGALLGACRSYGNVELGELAANKCLKLEPDDSSTFVMLSNIYAAAQNWEKVSLVRSMMQERGIRKEPGRSWIEVDNKIHAFVVGDTSHPETKEIYSELIRLTTKIKAEGYLPNTRLVLHDVDKKDKEFFVCSHSEKLAIAYGLMCSSSRKPINVYKNLRVCLDCHMATKLISKVTKREIVVRDTSRFHHFKDGLCSCNDYW